MNNVTIQSLKEKDIINIVDGKKLGRASDIELNQETMKIISLVIAGESKMFGLKKTSPTIINVKDVVMFGDDCILVNIKDENENANNISPSDFTFSKN